METTNEPKVESKSVATIGMDKAGLLQPKTIEEAFRLASAYHKSKLLPVRFNTPEMILVAMQFALELGLKPLTAMRQIAVVNGTPAAFGDLPLSLCYAKGSLESIKEFLFDKDGKEICAKNANLSNPAVGAYCVVKRRGDAEPRETFFTMDDARTAGLLNSPTWKSYPKLMLKYRARSQALKDKFPDALNGVAIAEYDFNTVPTEDSAPMTVAVAPVASLNDRLKAAKEVTAEVVESTTPSTMTATEAMSPERIEGAFAAFQNDPRNVK
jgi:hypothetical protein